MSIPVENVFHLLTYAWGLLRDDDALADATGLAEPLPLPHFLATELARTTEQLLRRGLLHQYVAYPPEETSRPRGKLLPTETLRTHALARGRAWCAPDNYKPDTLPNRLLRSTLHYLLHADVLLALDTPATATLRHQLGVLLPRLPAGPLLPVSAAGARIFTTIRPTRAITHYRLPLRLCRLIWQLSQTHPDPTETDPWLRALLLNDRRMAKLFEKFVRNFCAHHYQTFSTSADHLRWWFLPAETAPGLVPAMQTDVLLRHHRTKRPRLLIECKYYPEALANAARGHRKKLHTAHLYQLHAYYRHLALELSADMPFDALLLYPLAVTGQVERTYPLPGTSHRFRVATLNLNQSWQQVEDDLKMLLALPLL